MAIKIDRFLKIPGLIIAIALIILFTVGCSGKHSPVSPYPGDPDADYGIEAGNGINSGHNYGPVGGTMEQDNNLSYMPDEILIVMEDSSVTPDTSLIANLPLNPLQVITCRWGTVYRLEITDGTPVPEMVEILNADPMVRIAEPNFILYFCDEPYFPNDPMWAYADDPTDPRDSPYDQWGPAMVGASLVWNDSTGLEDIVVCVMDTGVKFDHEDLHDNIWINEDEIPDNGTDDDNNGYIDDWWGWDAWDMDNDPYDDGAYARYHGTACSGVVAAVQDNERGLSGIAPGIKIMAVKVDLTGYGGLVSTVVEGMNYASVNEADIVSMSFRTYDYSQIMETACDDAWQDGHGVILMGGIGNESTTTPCYPNAYDSVMAIGGSCPFTEYLQPRDEKRIVYGEDGFYWGSNYGNHMTVMGYGSQYTTTHGSHYSAYWDGYGSAGFFGGTSCATPMAAGVMALIKSYFPWKSGTWCWERIEQTADDLDVPGFDIQTGHGRVNALRAVFGSDRWAGLEDPDGFVTLDIPDAEIYDTIHDVPGNPYHDVYDLYRFAMDVTGYLYIDLDIFTWGENLDIELYSDPAMTNLIGSSTGQNHYYSSFEQIEFASGIAGEKYFLKVFSPAEGNSTTYGIQMESVSNVLTVTGESLAPIFIHQQGTDIPLLKLDLEIGIGATLDQLNISKAGSIPNPNVETLYVYRDSNDNKIYDENDELIAQESYPGSNRFKIENIGQYWTGELTLFITADLGYTPANSTLSLSVPSYKDVVTEEQIVAHYNQFPIVSDDMVIGTDTDPPVWDTIIGIQSAQAGYSSALLGFNEATDLLTPPVNYNVYYSDTFPFDIASAQTIQDIEVWPGILTDLEAKVYNLTGDIEWYFVVKAEDQAGNEDVNLETRSCIPIPGGDPANPVILNNIPGQATDVAYSGNLLVTTNGWAGIKVFDRTDPVYLVELGTWDDGGNYRNLSFDGTFAYITGQFNLTIVDCSNPSSPLTVNTYDIGQQDGILYGNWLYIDTTSPTSLQPLDITDPYSITWPPPVNLPAGFANQMIDYGSLLYLAHSNAGCMVFDLADPASPFYMNSFGPANLETLGIDGFILFAVNTMGDISTFDLSVNSVDPPLLDTNAESPSTFSKEIVIVNGHAYVSESNFGIYIYNITDPSSILLVGELDLYNADGLAADGSIIYAASSSGLNVIM